MTSGPVVSNRCGPESRKNVIGASLSEPHTRELNECVCVCLSVCQCARARMFWYCSNSYS